MVYTEQTVLEPVAPFDFDKSLSFLCGFEPTRNEHTVQQRALTKAIAIGDQTIVFRVEPETQADPARLACTLSSGRPLVPETVEETVRRVSAFLSLGDDLRGFYAIGREDQAFDKVVDALYGYHQVKFLTPFENACWAILAQRNPLPVAAVMKQALIEYFGNKLELDGTIYRAFPSVSQMRGCSAAQLASIVNNRRKAEYLHDVTRAFDEVEEQFLTTAPYAEVEGWLRGIHGIGAWSASFVLIRGIGRTEVIPPDKAVVRAAEKVYRQPLTAAAFCTLAERYGAWQGYWGHYLRVFA